MATSKREQEPQRISEEPEAKRPRIAASSAESESDNSVSPRVVLNPADCDLDFNIKDDLTGHALYEEGFAYCWSGARANVGISRGKYCFGCKIVSNQPVRMEDTPPQQQHVARIGISRGTEAVGNLGETEHSHGFGGTGKFSNAGKFLNYGETFGVDDTIVCAVDLESNPASIGFSKNGKWLGVAKHFNAGHQALADNITSSIDRPWESAMFPHVLLKNVVVQMQFSTEDGLVVEEGYKPWASALEDGNAIMGPSVSDASKCEVMMLVGLPASGKSTWADKWVKGHPEKHYVLLGTNLVLDQMKVPGLLRKHNYGERFDRLMDRATGIFNTLLSRASRTPRNYIIDQTNVYKNARKRKLKPFLAYRKIAVVVFPKPEDLKLRAEKRFREMGKEVPAEAVNEMLANYVLPMSKDMPRTDEYFDEVIFTELNRVEAESYLGEMKRELAALSGGNPKSVGSTFSQESSTRSDFGNSPLTGPMYQHYSKASHFGGHASVAPIPRPVSSYAIQPSVNVPVLFAGSEQSARLESYARAHQASLTTPEGRDAYHGTYPSYGASAPIQNPSHYSANRIDFYCSYDTESRINNYVGQSGSQIAVSGQYSHRDGGSGSVVHTGGVVSYRSAERSATFQPPLETGRTMYSYGSGDQYPTHPADLRPATRPLTKPFQQNQFPSSYGSPYGSYPRAPGTSPAGAAYMGGSYHDFHRPPPPPPRYY